MVPDLPLVDVPACVVHGERFAELRHDAAGTPLPAPAGTHLATWHLRFQTATPS